MDIIFTAFFILMIIISITDFIFYEIKDIHIICLIALSVFKWILKSNPGIDLFYTFCVASVIFVILYFLSVKDFIGGGDVKLAPVLILFLGYKESYDFFFITSLIGGMIAACYILFTKYINILRSFLFKIFSNKLCKFLLNSFDNEFFYIEYKGISKIEIPYGIALCMGAFLSEVL